MQVLFIKFDTCTHITGEISLMYPSDMWSAYTHDICDPTHAIIREKNSECVSPCKCLTQPENITYVCFLL